MNFVRNELINWVWRAMPYRMRRALIRLTQSSFTISAAVILFNADENVLLLKHVLRANRGGWGIPGGFLNDNEQPVAALERELFEETGINTTNLRLVNVRTIGNHLEIIYRGEVNNKVKIKLAQSEILDARWFSIDEARKVVTGAQFAQIKLAVQSRVDRKL